MQYIALFGPGKDPAPFKIPRFIDDFTWIRDAILGCCQQHEICLSKQSLSVPGLLVIDCLADSSTISLVSAPKSCHYAALSYVWGGVHTTSIEVPAVIKDAIKVTVKLGLRFLWADRYAYVTIIAATGNTAADGLPGISTIPRRAQMETEIGGCTFLELPSIIDSTRASTWANRGWTYQEGLLSTRCLVFTDRGVLYHCRGRYSEESVQQLTPLNAAALTSDDDILKTIFAPTLRDYIQLQDQIVAYTRRQLSYPQDSLDAFLGIFADSASRSVYPPVHIWGLPLLEGITMLDWYHPEPPKRRRTDFPSWSWSGWEGGIKFKDRESCIWYSSTNSKYAPIFLEIPDKLTDPCDQKIRCLYGTGAIATLNFATQKQKQSIIDGAKQLPDDGELSNLDIKTSHHHVIFEVSPGVFTVIRADLDIEPEDDDQTFGLLVTEKGAQTYGSEKKDLFMIRSIIVLRKGDQSFTRIGCIGGEDYCEREFVNIKGASIAEEILPSSTKDRLLFGRECKRQRICLE
ncbi:hypothetical protein EAE96_005681 [Botrytis aclada]|nr:hypothetical protein EAE96_005681 [Botrytis aclada]